MEDNRELVVRESNILTLDYSNPEVLKTIRDNYAKNTTEEEFGLFLVHCKSSGLNPIRREIWCIKTSKGLQIMTGINGFYRCANSHPEFNGIETSLEFDEMTGHLSHAICKVWRKNMTNPIIGTAYYSDYFKSASDSWRNYPNRMLEKCAEALSLRKAFPQELSNIYEEGELDNLEAVETKSANQPIARQIFRYDISSVPENDHPKLIEFLNFSHARFLGGTIYESDWPLARLGMYEIKDRGNLEQPAAMESSN